MPVWTILDFVEESGRAPFCDWASSLPDGAQAAIDARLLALRGMSWWPEKWASDFRGVKDLKELRVPHDKVQYRPFFCYGVSRRQLVLLGGGIEKNGRIAAGLIKALSRRISDYKADPSRTREHVFD
jgi:hypothetical protein